MSQEKEGQPVPRESSVNAEPTKRNDEEEPRVETAEIYKNAFFEVQVYRRDTRFMRGFGLSGVAYDNSPFPDELSDEDILEWHDSVDDVFREGLGRRTIERLGDEPEGA